MVEKIKNQSVAEYARIQVGFLSGSLTTMLIVNALGITAIVGLLDTEFEAFEKAGLMLLVFSSITAIVLCFLAKKYIEGVSHRFLYIELNHMDAIAKVAKRFYLPFLLSLMANIFLALLGAITLLFRVI